MKSKLIKIGLAIALAFGFTFVASTPAQAFASFYYLADCPGTARYQQLVIQNWSGSPIGVDAAPNHPFGEWGFIGSTGNANVGGGITYFPVQWSDKVNYHFTGYGNLNWFYHVDCFY